jgi:hypothetical protein
VLMGLAVAALAGLLVFDLFVPAPTIKKSAQARMRNEQTVRDQTYKFKADVERIKKEVAARVWTGSADSVGAQALEMATSIAKSKGLKLTAFRPQKALDEGELWRLAFVMTLEGSFPGLQSVVRELETPSRRLSVHLVQVASADEASDLVNATIGVTAYLEKPKAKADTKDKQA